MSGKKVVLGGLERGVVCDNVVSRKALILRFGECVGRWGREEWLQKRRTGWLLKALTNDLLKLIHENCINEVEKSGTPPWRFLSKTNKAIAIHDMSYSYTKHASRPTLSENLPFTLHK